MKNLKVKNNSTKKYCENNNLQNFPVLRLPLMASRVAAGFPSPADDFIESHLDLNEYLIQHPSATFFAWAEGDSLKDIGIQGGDLLIIDRSVEAKHGSIVVAAIDGELTCKVLDAKLNRLLPANSRYSPIPLAGRDDVLIEGVVIYNIKSQY